MKHRILGAPLVSALLIGCSAQGAESSQQRTASPKPILDTNVNPTLTYDYEKDRQQSEDRSITDVPTESESGEKIYPGQGRSGSGAAQSGAILDENDFESLLSDSEESAAQSNKRSNSVNLTISNIIEDVKKHKDLTSTEIGRRAVMLVREDEKSATKRRGLSNKLVASGKEIERTKKVMINATKAHNKAVNDQTIIKQMEQLTIKQREKVKEAMYLYKDLIRDDPSVPAEIKEEIYEAGQPEGKLTYWEKMWNGKSCNLL